MKVCHTLRIQSHRVFDGLAATGKSSTGWFYGFILHLVCNERGELLNLALTPGNVDDRKPVSKLSRHLFGKLFRDQGYISEALFEHLMQTSNVQLVTRIRSNMKNSLIPMLDKILLRKHAIIESIIDQLKNISQIEHSHHRSPINFMVNPQDTPHLSSILAKGDDILANGGSCIAGPDGRWIVEPLVGEEKLIIASFDHQHVREERQNFDPSGHYSRPDVLQLKINRQRQSAISFGE